MKKIFIVLLIGIMIAGVSVNAAETKLIYSERHVFKLTTPDGWTMDEKVVRSTGLPYFIRPDDEPENVYIYALGFDRPDGNTQTIKDFVANDTRDYKAKYKGIKVKNLNLKFNNLKKSDVLPGKYFVKEFSNFDNTYKEIVVYIEFPEGVGTLVYSSLNQESYKLYYDTFISFVNSFEFVGNQMNVINMDNIKE